MYRGEMGPVFLRVLFFFPGQSSHTVPSGTSNPVPLSVAMKCASYAEGGAWLDSDAKGDAEWQEGPTCSRV